MLVGELNLVKTIFIFVKINYFIRATYYIFKLTILSEQF